MLTIKDVETRVKEISTFVSDPEAAHSLEDALFVDILEAICASWPLSGMTPELAKGLALAALRSREIDFPRWCA